MSLFVQLCYIMLLIINHVGELIFVFYVFFYYYYFLIVCDMLFFFSITIKMFISVIALLEAQWLSGWCAGFHIDQSGF